MKTVDLNADLGEGFGHYSMGDDEALFRWISSANMACGFHAGDPHTMRKTALRAAERGVSLGAHPGFPDLLGFGRRLLPYSPSEVYDLVVYQTGAAAAVARTAGVRLRHVKPHGALYNRASADLETAKAVAAAIQDLGGDLELYALAGSVLAEEGKRRGLRVVSEVFADRGYERDGSLTPRGSPGALVEDVAAAARRAVRMVVDGVVEAVDGTRLTVRADTICVHGDGRRAAELAAAARRALEEAGLRVSPPHGAAAGPE